MEPCNGRIHKKAYLRVQKVRMSRRDYVKEVLGLRLLVKEHNKQWLADRARSSRLSKTAGQNESTCDVRSGCEAAFPGGGYTVK